MSILLESLGQKNEPDEPGIPDIQSSHFDDELLGDEWLIKRIKLWRVLAIVASLIILVSWGYVYTQWKKVDSLTLQLESVKQATSQNALKSATKEKSDNALARQTEKAAAIPALESNGTSNLKSSNEITNNEKTDNMKLESAANAQVANKKAEYVPKKRDPAVVTQSKTKPTQKKSVTSNGRVTNKSFSTVLLEELPPSAFQDFPRISLGSYVVSENPEESFVILDGSFYQVNQVIAPELTLREINAEFLVVEFRQYFVKIPH